MIDSLVQLGLSEKEARIYELLSVSEALTAARIARQVDIKRASIYELLQGLEKHGLIGHYHKHGTSYFYLESPERLLLDYQAKLKIAEEVTKTLRQKRKKQTITLEVYRDKEGFSELYRDILTTSGKEFCAWSNFESFDRIIDKKSDARWTRERVERGTRPRLIMVENAISKDFKAHDSHAPRMTKLIKSGKNFTSTLVVSGETVYIFDDAPEVMALKIRHPNIATMLQEIFDTYWQELH